MMSVNGSEAPGKSETKRHPEQRAHRRAKDGEAFAEHQDNQADRDYKNWIHVISSVNVGYEMKTDFE